MMQWLKRYSVNWGLLIDEIEGYLESLGVTLTGILVQAAGMAVGQLLPAPWMYTGFLVFALGFAVQVKGVLGMVANLDRFSPQRQIRVYTPRTRYRELLTV